MQEMKDIKVENHGKSILSGVVKETLGIYLSIAVE